MCQCQQSGKSCHCGSGKCGCGPKCSCPQECKSGKSGKPAGADDSRNHNQNNKNQHNK